MGLELHGIALPAPVSGVDRAPVAQAGRRRAATQLGSMEDSAVPSATSSPDQTRLKEYLEQLRNENRPVKWQRRFEKIASQLEDAITAMRTASEQRQVLQLRIKRQTRMLQLMDLEEGWQQQRRRTAFPTLQQQQQPESDAQAPVPMQLDGPQPPASSTGADKVPNFDPTGAVPLPPPPTPPPPVGPLKFLELPAPEAWSQAWERRVLTLTARDLAQLHCDWLQCSALLVCKAELLGPSCAEYAQLHEFSERYAAFNQHAIRLVPGEWRLRSHYDLRTLQPTAQVPEKSWLEDFLDTHTKSREAMMDAYLEYYAVMAKLRDQYSALVSCYLYLATIYANARPRPAPGSGSGGQQPPSNPTAGEGAVGAALPAAAREGATPSSSHAQGQQGMGGAGPPAAAGNSGAGGFGSGVALSAFMAPPAPLQRFPNPAVGPPAAAPAGGVSGSGMDGSGTGSASAGGAAAGASRTRLTDAASSAAAAAGADAPGHAAAQQAADPGSKFDLPGQGALVPGAGPGGIPDIVTALDEALRSIQGNLSMQQLVMRQYVYAVRHSENAVHQLKAHLLLYPLALDVIDFFEVLAGHMGAANGGGGGGELPTAGGAAPAAGAGAGAAGVQATAAGAAAVPAPAAATGAQASAADQPLAAPPGAALAAAPGTKARPASFAKHPASAHGSGTTPPTALAAPGSLGNAGPSAFRRVGEHSPMAIDGQEGHMRKRPPPAAAPGPGAGAAGQVQTAAATHGSGASGSIQGPVPAQLLAPLGVLQAHAGPLAAGPLSQQLAQIEATHLALQAAAAASQQTAALQQAAAQQVHAAAATAAVQQSAAAAAGAGAEPLNTSGGGEDAAGSGQAAAGACQAQ